MTGVELTANRVMWIMLPGAQSLRGPSTEKAAGNPGGLSCESNTRAVACPK